MIVSVIGYKNHAQKIIDILINVTSVKKLLVYHPTKKFKNNTLTLKNKKIFYTNIWQDLTGTDCYFICAPSYYHYFYLKKIISSDPKSFIYCEKPPVVSYSQIKWLENNKLKIYKRVLFGFNFRFSKFYKLIDKIINKNKLGSPVFANFNLSYGIAFKDNMIDDWRFNDTSIFSRVTGNLGIHYLNFCQGLFGNIVEKKIFESNNANLNQNDTSINVFKTQKNVLVSIFTSYATVFNEEVDIFFTDGIVSKKQNKVFLYSPRDTFNNNGYFIKPEGKLILENLDQDNGLIEAIHFFINSFQRKKYFDINMFEDAIKSNKFFIR